MQKRNIKNFVGSAELDKAIAYLRKNQIGGFCLSETCRTTIFKLAKKAGWKPDA